jgi:hypothetical protein
LTIANPSHWYQRSGSTLVTTTSETSLSVSAGVSAGWLFPVVEPAALAAVVQVRALFTLSGPQNNVDCYMRIGNTVLANAAAWDSTLPSPFDSGLGGGVVTFTVPFRAAWNAISRGAIGGVELRFVDTGGFTRTVSNVQLDYTLAVQRYPTSGTIVVGGKTVQTTTWLAETRGRFSVGGHPVEYTTFPTTGRVAFGGTTNEGTIYATSGTVQIGGKTRLQVNWPTRGGVAFGGATRDLNRYVVPLRLKAAKVSSDVGFMWVPVYLQLPISDHVADWPWEFYYPDGRKIPFLIRNRVGHQVRALVYMRPSVTMAQDFFCRVG